MYLYNVTLQRATGITHAIHGNFSGSKIQEILISHGKSLELVRPDPNTGKVLTLLQTEIFGVIRSMMAFRLTGSTKGELRPFASISTNSNCQALVKVLSVVVNSSAKSNDYIASLLKYAFHLYFDLKTFVTLPDH